MQTQTNLENAAADAGCARGDFLLAPGVAPVPLGEGPAHRGFPPGEFGAVP